MAVSIIALLSGCSRSMFMQSPWNAIPKATADEIAQLFQPESLRADLDTIVALLEMSYQFEQDYRFDSSKIARAYGITATPMRQGLAEHLTFLGHTLVAGGVNNSEVSP